MKKRSMLLALSLFACIPLFGCGNSGPKPQPGIYYSVNLASNSLKLFGKGATLAWANYTAQIVVKDTRIYSLPESISVQVSGKELEKQKYNYDPSSGVVNINKEGVIGNIHIMAEAVRSADKHIITASTPSFGFSFIDENKPVDHLIYEENQVAASGLNIKMKTINNNVFIKPNDIAVGIKKIDGSIEPITAYEKTIKEDGSIDITIQKSVCTNDLVIDAQASDIKAVCLEYLKEDEPIVEKVANVVEFEIKKSSKSSQEIVVDWGDGSSDKTSKESTIVSHTFDPNIKSSYIIISGPVISVFNFAQRDVDNHLNNITRIALSDTINDICDNNFYNFRNLKAVIISNAASIEHIGSQAFCHSQKLEYINIPNDVTAIGNEAFLSCTALGEVHFAETSKLSNIEMRAFMDCNGSYSLTGLTKIVLPKIDTASSSLIISEEAFMNCSKLKEVVFTDEETKSSIKKRAFAYCSDLTTINLRQTYEIDNYAFYACTKLENLSIDNEAHITDIGAGAFANDISLTSFKFPKGVRTIDNDSENPELGAFQGCTALTTVTIDDDSMLETISAYSFVGCTALTEINIKSKHLKTIDIGTFYGCSNLKTIDMSATDSFIMFEKDAFPPSSQLDTIYVKNSLLSEYQENAAWMSYRGKFQGK